VYPFNPTQPVHEVIEGTVMHLIYINDPSVPTRVQGSLRKARARTEKMVAVQPVEILLRIIAEDPNRNESQWGKTLINQDFPRTATTTAAAQQQ